MSIDIEGQVLRPERIATLRAEAAHDRHLRAMRGAVGRLGITKVALDQERLNQVVHSFSEELPSPGVTDQMKSGRCWMFAGVNLLRRSAAHELNAKEFELSQNYLTFWEKLEKANCFLDDVLTTLDEEKDSRLLGQLFASPAGDGGEWELFANLVLKYGVVPTAAMPETHHANESQLMVTILNAKLREDGLGLRRAHRAGATRGDLLARRDRMLDEIYRMLSVFLGLPPETFDLEYRDKDDAFHREAGLSPHAFLERHVDFDPDAYVSLVNVPTADKPFGVAYLVDHLPVVRGGTPRPYLNVDAEVMRQAALRQLEAGEGVYFGCDVAQMMDIEQGILADGLYDLRAVLGVPVRESKADRLDYLGEIAGGHQMVLSGVHRVDGRPVRWKVENSWGDKHGEKGYFAMTDGWFEEYVYQVVVRKAYLDPGLLAALDRPPVHLPPWDPMRGL